MATSTTGIPKKKGSGGKTASAPDAPTKGKKGVEVELTEEDLKKVSGGSIGGYRKI